VKVTKIDADEMLDGVVVYLERQKGSDGIRKVTYAVMGGDAKRRSEQFFVCACIFWFWGGPPKHPYHRGLDSMGEERS